MGQQILHFITNQVHFNYMGMPTHIGLETQIKKYQQVGFVWSFAIILSCGARKSNTVARSSTEAEYRSLANAVAEVSWIPMLLSVLKVPLLVPPVIWCDNVFVMSLAHNPVFHGRTKHFELDYHFVRDKVLQRCLQVY